MANGAPAGSAAYAAIVPTPLTTPRPADPLRDGLIDRRARLDAAIDEVGRAEDLVRLLNEVDDALARFDDGTLGTCEVCGEPVGDELLLTNPLARYCLCEPDAGRWSALEKDLDLAWRIQSGLLPPQDLAVDGWRTHYRYLPAGRVSGDYCDLVATRDEAGTLHFLLGDVSGKGVAASFLMAHLHALFRSLIEAELPLSALLERANRIFSSSTLSSHYATMVVGRATADGEVELSNAGHLPPLRGRRADAAVKVARLSGNGFPIGMFGEARYESHRLRLAEGETLLLYTDGLTESHNGDGHEFGIERLSRTLARCNDMEPGDLAAACLDDVDWFRDGSPRADDTTIMVLRRA